MLQNKNVQVAGKGDYDLTQKTPLVSSRALGSQRKGKSQLLKISGGPESLSRSRCRELAALTSASAIEKIEGGGGRKGVSKFDVPIGLSPREDNVGVKNEPITANLDMSHFHVSTNKTVSPTSFRTAEPSKSDVSVFQRVEPDSLKDVVMDDGSIVAGEGIILPEVVPHGSKNRTDEDGHHGHSKSHMCSISNQRSNLKLDKIVLKFTTMVEGIDQQSFVVGRNGASIGQGNDNSICIPNDTCMTESEHVIIEWREGSFYLFDQGQPYGAAIRVGMGLRRWDWPLAVNAMFSAGCSVFKVVGFDKEGCLMLEILSGPLKGERRRVPKDGATLGRSTENNISIPDRELSRKHSKIQWLPDGDGLVHPFSMDASDGVLGKSCSKEFSQQHQETGGFYLTDVGSTNGSYMRLVGPYSSSLRLSLSDHILIGRTGFSINRYDWGIWEDRGVRRTMEDKCVIIQDMGVRELNAMGLSPQTYMAIYDGHGGVEAAEYLWQHLHVNVADALGRAAPRIAAAVQKVQEGRGGTNGDDDPSASLNDVIGEVVKQSFIEADAQFIATSSRPQCGSTATTVIILGNRFYSFNVGDSRTILCRKNASIISSAHKPSREDEHTRIKEAGGLVINKRVMGELAVSRAFGDKEFKVGIKSIMSEGESGSIVSSAAGAAEIVEEKSGRYDTYRNTTSAVHDWKEGERPEGEELITETHVETKSPKRSTPREWSSDSPLITAEPEMLCSTLTEEDEFVLLACDGLFDVYSTEEVVDIVRAEMALHVDAQRTCEVLTERAILERYSRDNVSIVLMVFSGMEPTSRRQECC